jgi:hypothetical protein
MNEPNGVSTSAVWYNSSTFVATHNAGRVSNAPRGWHRSKSSWVSRSCSVPVMSSTTLSIMYAYLEHTGQHQHRVVTIRIGENVRDVVKELAERFDGIGPQEVELIDENLGRLFSNGRGGNGGGFVGEEVSVVGCRQLGPKVCRNK